MESVTKSRYKFPNGLMIFAEGGKGKKEGELWSKSISKEKGPRRRKIHLFNRVFDDDENMVVICWMYGMNRGLKAMHPWTIAKNMNRSIEVQEMRICIPLLR